MRSTISGIILALGTAASLFGQESIQLHRLSGPINFDGLSDEAAWEAIPPFPLTMYQPTFGGAPTERTEIRVGYDDTYVYVAGRMWDSGPNSRQISSLKRDQINDDDLLVLFLDTFNDNENSVMFATTPAGIRYDATVSGDGQNFFGGGINSSWNTFWDAAVRQTHEGWFAEIRVPFSSLRFQEEDGTVTMGLKVFRRLSKRNEIVTYPETQTEWSAGLERPSRYRDATFRGVTRRNPIYISPYVLLGGSRTPRLTASGNGFEGVNDSETEVGLDIKYGVTSNMTLDLSVNTDFAQVEADDQQVNLTRFSLFFPERRQFFQERSGIFNISLNDFARVFHSRRIGLNDDGTPVRILGGARLVGRAGKWDVGVINMQTAAEDGRPSENNGVYRIRRRLFNEASYLGGMVTARLGDDGDYNVVYVADGTVRVFGNDYMGFQAAQSVDRDIELTGINSSRIRFVWQRRSDRGLGYGTWITRSGQNFEPGLGFIQRSDFTRYELLTQYGYFPGSRTVFRFITPSLYGTVFYRNSDGTAETYNVSNFWNFGFKSGAFFGLSFIRNFDDLRQGFSLSADAQVPAGEHTFHMGSFSFATVPGRAFVLSGGARFGEFYDGTQRSFRLDPTWIASTQLRVTGTYRYNEIDFSQRSQEFVSHLARVRIEAAADSHLSGSVFIQFSSTADALSTNVRFRYHFSEGRDVFLVYNETLDTDRGLLNGGPVRDPLSLDRTVVVKYVHTFIR